MATPKAPKPSKPAPIKPAPIKKPIPQTTPPAKKPTPTMKEWKKMYGVEGVDWSTRRRTTAKKR